MRLLDAQSINRNIKCLHLFTLGALIDFREVRITRDMPLLATPLANWPLHGLRALPLEL